MYICVHMLSYTIRYEIVAINKQRTNTKKQKMFRFTQLNSISMIIVIDKNLYNIIGLSY